jgi:hypothetical protein
MVAAHSGDGQNGYCTFLAELHIVVKVKMGTAHFVDIPKWRLHVSGDIEWARHIFWGNSHSGHHN